jgi:hypothetical protein
MSSGRSRNGGSATQRWERDCDDVDSIKEIGAKAAGAYVSLEIAVGRGDDADVDGGRRRGTDAAHLAILQGAQQLHLEGRRQLANLIEEEGSLVGFLEQPSLLTCRAGERASLVTEQLALEQRLRKRAAVHCNEWPFRARALSMNELRDQLFSRTTLAGDEHGRRMRSHLPREVERRLHQTTPAYDDVRGKTQRREFAFQPSHFSPESLALHRFADDQHELLGAEWLLDPVVRATLHCCDRRLRIAVRAHHDHERGSSRCDMPFEERHPIHRGHTNIAKDEIKGCRRELRERILTIGGAHHLVPFLVQNHGEGLPQCRFVVDDENAHAAHGASTP